MRNLIAYVLLALAVWRGWIDWQATVSAGEAFSMASVTEVWQQISLASYDKYVPMLQASTIPNLWDPIAVTFLGFPMTVVLLALGAFFWLIRRKTKPAKRY